MLYIHVPYYYPSVLVFVDHFTVLGKQFIYSATGLAQGAKFK